MDSTTFIDAIILMLVLFNPLLMSAYLHDVMGRLSTPVFFRIIGRAFLISGLVFCLFAWAGDRIVSRVLQVRFAAFLIFGGVVFLIIAVRYMVVGADMIGQLRGDSEHISGAIAMPFMIGPGTISASVLTGSKMSIVVARGAIVIALTLSCLFLMGIKLVYDYVQQRNERMIERYMESIGRGSALLVGTIAVEMILKGIDLWLVESR